MKAFLQHRLLVFSAALLLVLLGIVVAAVVVFSWGKEIGERHSPFPNLGPFDFERSGFAEYRTWAEARIRSVRGESASEAVIANLLPFRLEPAASCPAAQGARFRNGIVLTHDLLESPYSMREIGEYFQSRCFFVLGLLLPGHGTRPGDFLGVYWEDWALAQQFATRELAREVDNIYLAGHGVGGTLAILEAARNEAIDGLVLFAPALGSRFANWYDGLVTPLSRLVPRAGWAEVLPDKGAYRYGSRPYSLGVETNALIQALEAALPNRPFEVPVFTVASLEDNSVSSDAILAFMAQRVHPMSHTLLYSQYPAVVGSERMTVVDSFRPEQTLLSLSHSGLMLPQEDPHYGWYGSDKDCGHYYRAAPETYVECTVGTRNLKGEITPENLARGLLERIGFNPFYYDMLNLLDRFLAPVAPVPAPRSPR